MIFFPPPSAFLFFREFRYSLIFFIFRIGNVKHLTWWFFAHARRAKQLTDFQKKESHFRGKKKKKFLELKRKINSLLLFFTSAKRRLDSGRVAAAAAAADNDIIWWKSAVDWRLPTQLAKRSFSLFLFFILCVCSLSFLLLFFQPMNWSMAVGRRNVSCKYFLDFFYFSFRYGIRRDSNGIKREREEEE